MASAMRSVIEADQDPERRQSATVKDEQRKWEETWLLAIGAALYKGSRIKKLTDELCAISITGSTAQIVNMGKVGSGVHTIGMRLMCVDNKAVYISGLGPGRDEIWRCVVDGPNLVQTERFGCMAEDRQFQGMAFHQGNLYIVGGWSDNTKTCVPTIEVWDTHSATSHCLQALKYENLYHQSKAFVSSSITCAIVDDYLVIYGPYVSKDDLQHTVQLFSLSQQKVTHSMTVPRITDWAATSIHNIGNNRLLLMADDYTTHCTLQDILHGKPDNIVFCDNFVVPNGRCAVVLSEDKSQVSLYSGYTKPGSTRHYIYTASVQDILQNAAQGWTRLQGDWPLKSYDMYAYDRLGVNK